MTSLSLKHMQRLLPPRPEQSHKASFGHVLNVAGSMNYRGAAYLSSLSALRVGAGYVTLATSPSVCQSISAQTADVVTLPLLTRAKLTQALLTHAPTIQDISTRKLPLNPLALSHITQDNEALAPEAINQLIPLLSKTTAISIGSGLGMIQANHYVQTEANASSDTLDTEPMAPEQVGHCPRDNYGFFCALLRALTYCETPLILDADGLNFFAYARRLETFSLPMNSLLTPHPKELSRLLAVTVSTIESDRVHYAKLAAQQFNAVIVLKGKNTVITDGNRVFINSTGSSALAKAGTGDVLTGMIAGFCAQAVPPLDAACLSVYLHGLAGDIAAKELSAYSLLASELLDYIPRAIVQLLKAKT